VSSVIIDSHIQRIYFTPPSQPMPESVNKLPWRLSFGDIAKFGIYLNLNFRWTYPGIANCRKLCILIFNQRMSYIPEYVLWTLMYTYEYRTFSHVSQATVISHYMTFFLAKCSLYPKIMKKELVLWIAITIFKDLIAKLWKQLNLKK